MNPGSGFNKGQKSRPAPLTFTNLLHKKFSRVKSAEKMLFADFHPGTVGFFGNKTSMNRSYAMQPLSNQTSGSFEVLWAILI
jgi:hypothetical protein